MCQKINKYIIYSQKVHNNMDVRVIYKKIMGYTTMFIYF